MMVLMCVVSVMCFHFDINDGAISNIVHEVNFKKCCLNVKLKQTHVVE